DRDGAGSSAARPLNDYVDYQVPIDGTSTTTIRVLGARVRQNFEAQNLELNLWRFGAPSCGGIACGGCGGGGCGATCGTGGCGNQCGYDTCGCAPCAAPQRFFLSGLAGLRYFRMDETFEQAFSFTDTDTGSWPSDPTVYPGGFPKDDPRAIFDEINIDNELLGFQLGCSMNRCVGCKWTLFCDTNFGIYNNNIEKHHCVYGGSGKATFVNGGYDADIRSSTDEIAFLGEARCGVAYQFSCRARLTAAWRVIAASGIALASEHVQPDFSNIDHVRYIDSHDSLILHGLQAGVEMKF
ncbi:MAG: BBP7 family outer membrane beta-barrel protein, partial [Planctomycetota bacterium]